MRKIVALTLALTVLFASSCGSKNVNFSDKNKAENYSSNDNNTNGNSINKTNRLTGLESLSEEAMGKRPIAVMVNNIKQSLPQYGIEKADIIYELPVEGGITRLMALYGDYTSVPNVCSIRSSRYYFPVIAYGLDAIYCHWGADKTVATDTLKRLEIDRFDGYYSSLKYDLFYRDKNRLDQYSLEHTAYLKGGELPRAIKDAGYRIDLNEFNKGTVFNFYDKNEEASLVGEKADNVSIHFSKAYFSDFIYNDEDNVYLKKHSGSNHIDSETGNQLSFTNVFILRTEISLMANSNKLMDVNLKKGNGYYISNGKYVKIKWTLESENTPIKYYDENNVELKVFTGKSYVAIVDSSNEIVVN